MQGQKLLQFTANYEQTTSQIKYPNSDNITWEKKQKNIENEQFNLYKILKNHAWKMRDSAIFCALPTKNWFSYQLLKMTADKLSKESKIESITQPRRLAMAGKNLGVRRQDSEFI